MAQEYLDDGSIENACPPLKALLVIMAEGSFEGKTHLDPEIRDLFTRESLLKSDWYKGRLLNRQSRDAALWKRHAEYLKKFVANPHNERVSGRMGIAGRITYVNAQLKRVQSDAYLDELNGCLGTDSF